ncbi:MAG: hypothetical protein H6581_18115 [Bacteroidia bacterium]|nr:hypothetical protein [Bacteroidia bacterium]
MKKIISRTVLFSSFALIMGATAVSCASRAHCPAVAGTGNSASASHKGASGKYCAGVKGTGTIKPKQKKRIEDGNFSKKMEREKLRAQNKPHDPIQQKTLEVK